jgi:hypothetical protein
MVAWQVEFYIIPRRALASHGVLDSSDLDGTPWWTTHGLPADYQKRLGTVASAGPSSSAELQTRGSPDGNGVDVWSADGRVSAVMARVDGRRLDSRLGAALIHFVRIVQAVLVRSGRLVVEPQIASSTAARTASAACRCLTRRADARCGTRSGTRRTGGPAVRASARAPRSPAATRVKCAHARSRGASTTRSGRSARRARSS